MEDHKTYQRAVGASFLGIVLQFLVAVALLVLWLWAQRNEVLEAAFYHGLGGLGIWAALWFLYMQHKRERIEALEAEQIARRHGTDTSIFETTADDLAVQQKHLRLMYRWMIPTVSLLTSAYLIYLGAQVLRRNAARVEALVVPEQGKLLGLMALFALIAFAGFAASRYVAGMSKVPQWLLLRSGASYLMGNVLVAFLLALSLLLAHLEFEWPFRAMIYVVPIFMILIGVEIVLNFVLNLYRPRKLGEVPRPAFDSRVLSLLTSPESLAKSINEAINYQFGFEITQSWFWKLLSEWFARLVGLGVVVILLISCIVIVEPNQLAVVTRFGGIVGEPKEPGLHLKLPWPIDRAEFYDVHALRVITIGKSETTDELAFFREIRDPMEPTTTDERVVLWSNRHADDELNMIVAPPPEITQFDEQQQLEEEDPLAEPTLTQEPARPQDSRAVPVSLVNAEVMVYYRVDPQNLRQYITSHADAQSVERKYERTARERSRWTPTQRAADKFKPAPNVHASRLRNLAIEHVTRFLLRHTVDEWIGAASIQATPQLLATIRQEARPLGVEVIDVVIAGVHPPQKVADAFHEVINAQQQSQTTVENAERDAIRIKAEAAGSVEMAERIHRLILNRDRMRVRGASEAELAEVDRRIEDELRRAGGQTAVLIAQARAERWNLENRERGRALAFEAQRSAYRASPSFYTARKYLQVLSEGLADANKFIVAADRSLLTIRGDYKEVETTFSFDKPDER
jgi:modulator of FtsH protease HflK